MSVYYMCVPGSTEARRGHQIAWDCSTCMWVLWIDPGSPGRTAYALNHWANTLAFIVLYKRIFLLNDASCFWISFAVNCLLVLFGPFWAVAFFFFLAHMNSVYPFHMCCRCCHSLLSVLHSSHEKFLINLSLLKLLKYLCLLFKKPFFNSLLWFF